MIFQDGHCNLRRARGFSERSVYQWPRSSHFSSVTTRLKKPARRLSAAHEAAAMDVLCADKTGTLTRNTLEVVDVVAMIGFDRERLLALAALSSSEADQDPIDAAIRSTAATAHAPERLTRFRPPVLPTFSSGISRTTI